MSITLPSHNNRNLAEHTQTQLHDLLRAAARPHDLERLLRDRWDRRWKNLMRDEMLMGVAVRRAAQCVRDHAHRLPPFLRFVIACAWFNGLCTNHRFQRGGSCLFCRGPTDALEHYAFCRVVKALFSHYLGVSPTSFPEFLGLTSDFESFTRLALGLHAVKATVETARALPSLAARYSAEALFRADLQASIRKWPGTNARIRSLAVMPRPASFHWTNAARTTCVPPFVFCFGLLLFC